MTAQVISMLRRRSAGPCNSGTLPGQVSKPCGAEPTRMYPAGPRCSAHTPSSPASAGAA